MSSNSVSNIKSSFGLFRAGCIYTLICPDTNLIKYVGKTFNPKARFYRHVSYETRDKSKKGIWIKSLIKNGKKPIIEIIDDCDEFNWQEKEIAYIKLYKSFGVKLLNMTKGGEQGALNYTFTETQSEKLSKSLKGKQKTKEHTENAKNARIESLKNNPELKKKLAMVSGNTLRNLTDEQKVKSKSKRLLGQAKRAKIKLCDFYKIYNKSKSNNETLLKCSQDAGYKYANIFNAKNKFIKK